MSLGGTSGSAARLPQPLKANVRSPPETLMEELVEKALSAKRESKYIEFKSEFDPKSAQNWCEVIKDIVAIANSGGGVIVIGVDNVGKPTGYDSSQFLNIDSADITNKIAKYLGQQFSDFEIVAREKNGETIALMLIHEVPIPLVFKKPGTYDVGGGRQKTAFKEGSVYFRHGAKSEPGDTDDLRRHFERELDRVKKSWLGGINKVVKAPRDSEIMVFARDVRETTDSSAIPIRLTTDPSAPAYKKIDPDVTHPYRQKELIKEVRKRLPRNVIFNSYDVTSLWYAHGIGNQPEFFHAPRFGSTQYSDVYIEWIVENYKKDKKFLEKARNRHYEIKHK